MDIFVLTGTLLTGAVDGAFRPLGPALAAFLAPLGVELPGRTAAPIENTRGEIVGEIVALGS